MNTLRLLEKKLKVQQQIYNKALKAAVKASAQLKSHRQQLDYLQQIQSEYSPAEGLTFNRLALLNRRHFVDYLQQMALHQLQQVEQDKQQSELCNQKVFEEKQKLDALEKKVSQQQTLRKIEAERKEQALVDDLVNSRFQPASD
ncbi:flagellar FliJ family protein [Endozoicomonas sp. Mp262]|uniref:flagellar FliJ family protein n=1 Tax=Endozoicomonas sp. Mp262 TaxID=2919499 RepID=UPI0021D9A030